MTIRTPPLPSADTDPARPSHPLLSVVLPTALTLAAVLGIGVWLLHGGSPDRPVAAPAAERGPAAVSDETLAGQERGGLAGLQDDLGQGRQPPPPYVVYLVANAEQQRAMTELDLTESETVLLAGTPEEQTAAYAHIELLKMNAPTEPVARAVRVVDLRPSPDPAATAPTLDGRRQEDRLAAADDAPQPRRTEEGQTVYLVGSVEQADAIRRGIAEAEAIRADVAAPPLTVHTAVLVIAAEEEERMLRALGDADATRDSLGLPGLVVVDLRTPA